MAKKTEIKQPSMKGVTLIDMIVKRTEMEFEQKRKIKAYRDLQSEVKSLGQEISELNIKIGMFALEKTSPEMAEDYKNTLNGKKNGKNR